ncbi:FG-GAP repeat protein [Sphaerisporangium corydalis]|uniref:FG-GAP repeat protein n=1 Tax=Sphaerisporangium corydalis TaxID=1441875 RepID=A0ABV9ETZ2_9ACTN|nr:FG-GAP repeat protein [Sphaerisporangium corydalis]
MTWRSALVSPLLAGLLATSFAGVVVPRAEAAADCSNAGPNDFDGDGRDDVAVGDPLADAGNVQGAGSVHILPTGGEGTGNGVVVTAPDGKAGDAFGWTVRTAHVDGDRCLDVIVGAPYADAGGTADAGIAYVIRGGAYDGRVPPEAITTITPPRPERNAHFGWALAAARSPSRPGGTIVVSAPYEDADATTDSGAIYAYAADADGAPGAAHRVTQESDGVVGNGEGGDMFGWSLVLGRLGGSADALDVAIGSPYENDDGAGKQSGDAGKADTGSVEIIYDVAEAGQTFTSTKWGIPDSVRDVTEHAGDRYGYAIAYAEFEGKPYLAASAPLADMAGVPDSGLVQTFELDPSGAVKPAKSIRLGAGGLAGQPAQQKAALGWSLAMVGKAGSLCLAIGSPFGSQGGAEAGTIFEVYLNGDQAGRLLGKEKPQAYDHLGWSVAAFGAPDAFAPGAGLVAGVPDERTSPGGAVAIILDGGPAKLLIPGRAGVPAVPGGSSADFGASVSG